jgi:hypothetical protein
MLEQLGHALEAADAAAVIATMAEDVTLRVAVHDEPFEGLPAATQILGGVLDGALHDIEVLQTIDGHDGAVLMFSTGVAGHPGRADGLLVVRSEGDGHIGRWANVGVGADGTPDQADVRAEVARGRVLVRVQLPPENTTAP